MSTDLKTPVLEAVQALLTLGDDAECIGTYKDKPTSYLSKDRRGAEYVADRVAGDDNYEYRLNGAGLKLYSSSFGGKVNMRVGGDQANLYPVYVQRANALLKERGLQRA